MKKELLYKTIMIVLMMTSLSGCKAPTDVYETLFKSTMRLINKAIDNFSSSTGFVAQIDER
ncbi:hypothetical protein BSR56_05050 [Acinetobacter haemolyticus]|nr:hypothetical protein BSR56_05050 [Acinetobacter haemolyticus]